MAEKGIGAAARKGIEKVDGVDPVKAAELVLEGPENDRIGSDGIGPEWTFQLDYTDARGRMWAGEFKAHVLTTKDRISVGLTLTRMANGIAFHLLDLTTSNLLEVLAHLTVALDERPPWAEDLTAIYDQGVLHALYQEVIGYEARFHGSKTPDPS